MSTILRAGRLLFAVLLLLPLPAAAADVTWTGAGADDAWSTPANWTPGLPGAGDHAIIPSGTPRSPRLTAPAATARLTLAAGAVLDARGFHLTLGAGPHEVAGTLVVGGAASSTTNALSIDGPLAVSGRLDWGSGQIYASTYYQPPGDRVLTILPAGEMRLVGAVDRSLSVTLVNQGTVHVEGGTTIYQQGYAHTSSGLLWFANETPAGWVGGGTNGVGPWVLTSTGTVRKTGAGTATFSEVELHTVGGAVDVQAGTLVLSGRENGSAWENASVAVASGAALRLTGFGRWHTLAGTLTGSLAGTFAVTAQGSGGFVAAAPGAAFELGGTGLQVEWAELGGRPVNGVFQPAPDNRGLVRFVGAVDGLVSGAFRNEGEVRWESGRLLYSRTAAIENAGVWVLAPSANAGFLTSGTNGLRPGPFVNTGTLRKAGAATVTTDVEFDHVGGTIDVSGGTLRVQQGGRFQDASVAVAAGAALRLENSGVPTVVAGTLAGTVEGLAVLRQHRIEADPAGGRLALGGTGLTVEYEGHLGLTQAGLSVLPPVNAGLVHFVDIDATVGAAWRNEGTIRWSNGLLRLPFPASLTNVGTVEIEQGAQQLIGYGPGETLSTVTNGPGGVLRKTGTGTTSLQASLVNHGRLDLASGTLRLDNALTNATRNTFTNAFGGSVVGTGTLDLSPLSTPDRIANAGTVAPGADDTPGTLTWRGRFPMDAQARLRLDVGPGPAGDRLDVIGTAVLASQLVVRTVGGYAPAVGDTFDGVTATTRAGEFESVSTVTQGSVVFEADYADPARVRLVATTGTPAPPFVVSPAPLVAGGVRTAVLLGDDLDAAAEVRLECRACADPAGSGTLAGIVVGPAEGGLDVAFDLTDVGAYGDYDVVLGTGPAARRSPVEVEPLLALPVLLPVGPQGVIVRPVPQGQTSQQALYLATNAAEPTLVLVQVDAPETIRFDPMTAQLAPGEETTRMLIVPVRPSLSQPTPLPFRSGISPENVRFPGQAALPDDPRLPLFSNVPVAFRATAGLSRFQVTEALSRIAYEVAAGLGQPVHPDTAFAAAARVVADLLDESPAGTARRSPLGRIASALGVSTRLGTELNVGGAFPAGMAGRIRDILGAAPANGCSGALQGVGSSGHGASCGGAPIPAPPPPVPVCPTDTDNTERRRRAIGNLIERALQNPSVQNTELIIRLQMQLDALPAPRRASGGDAGCNEDEPVVPQPIDAAFDPNDKRSLAPFGVEVLGEGPEAAAGRTLIPLASAAEPVVYTIRFENVPEATAAAETVTITDVLDDRFDPATLEFIGSTADSLLTIATSGQTVTFTFAGIELPPNQSPPEGEGAVSFRVRPRQAYPDGTEFRNTASIVFDANPPIVTPEVVHVVRATADLSVALSAPPSAEAGQPLVYTATVANAAGADPAAGAGVVLPVPSGAVLQSVEASAGSCSGSTTVACDLVTLAGGEAVTITVTVTPTAAGTLVLAAEASTATFDGSWFNDEVSTETDVFPVDTEPTPGLPTELTLEAPYPNPTAGRASVRLGLPEPVSATITVVDALGRTVIRRTEPTATPGWHVLPLPTDGLASGVYVLRLVAGEQVRVQRLTVVR